MQAAIPYLKIGAGVWVVTRAIRWGIPTLIPQNPEEGSLIYKIKSIYEGFQNSQHEYVVFIRLGLATTYDLLPVTAPLAFYKSSHVQNNFLEYLVTIDSLLKACWIVAFGFIRTLAEQQTYPCAAALAKRIQPSLEPTGFTRR